MARQEKSMSSWIVEEENRADGSKIFKVFTDQLGRKLTLFCDKEITATNFGITLNGSVNRIGVHIEAAEDEDHRRKIGWTRSITG